jgi:hypothetical protein
MINRNDICRVSLTAIIFNVVMDELLKKHIIQRYACLVRSALSFICFRGSPSCSNNGHVINLKQTDIALAKLNLTFLLYLKFELSNHKDLYQTSIWF